MSATMGAAPVPVPPPMPAVMNTISASSRALAIWVRLSSADLRPTSGSEPAPWPLGQLLADLDLIGRAGNGQRLLVRIDLFTSPFPLKPPPSPSLPSGSCSAPHTHIYIYPTIQS